MATRVLLALKPAQGPQLPTGQGMNRFGAAFDAADMHAAMGEVDGVPAQRHQLGRPQAVPVGDQHHGGVAVAMAVLPGSIDQTTNLAIGEVLAGADSALRLRRGGCRRSATVPITVVGATSVRCGFVMIFQASPRATVPNMSAHGTLYKAKNTDFTGITAILYPMAKMADMRETPGWQAFPNGRHHRNNRQPEEKDIADPRLGAAA